LFCGVRVSFVKITDGLSPFCSRVASYRLWKGTHSCPISVLGVAGSCTSHLVISRLVHPARTSGSRKRMVFKSWMMEPFETLTTESRSKGGAVIPSMVSWGASSIMTQRTRVALVCLRMSRGHELNTRFLESIL
jgi:hypothetical protein